MSRLKVLEYRDQYTVGWIAALPLERAAAIAILDEKHEAPLDFVQPQSDTNSYTWGRIGEHNLVIASLAVGKYGTTSAAATALPMLAAFPQIKIGLLVGIGAGVSGIGRSTRPGNGRDIRLGDVAVSQPHQDSGGVIQYDLIAAKSGDERESRAFLNSPPEVLLHALGNLQAQHELEPPKMLEYLEEIIARYPRLAKQGYVYQGFENDRLFTTSEIHGEEEVQRTPRDSTDPEIHYGVIASGNTLFKDATYRDRVLEDIGNDCICFEMEAAGLMNNFPCLVIRGICDYADSHKNDQWQRYAAATAAAYAKELLTYVPSQALQSTQTASDALKDISENVAEIRAITENTRSALKDLVSNNLFTQIQSWLSPPDPSYNLNEAHQKRQSGTGSWFLRSEPFKEWKSGAVRYMWLHGIPGCGKTILSATIIEYLQQQQLSSSNVGIYFFFDFTDLNKQTLDKLLRSLVLQLYSKCENSRPILEELLLACEAGRKQPAYGSLLTTFIEMICQVKKLQIIIDALDECTTKEELLSWMEDLVNRGYPGLHLLATSRKEEAIESRLKRWLKCDIRTYVHENLRSDLRFERWRSQPLVQNEIETELVGKACGMFRWAACQLDILQKCLDLQMVRDTLRSLPETLQETYARVLAGIDEHYRQYAIRLLQFLTYSTGSLKIQEAVDIIAVDLSRKPSFDPNLRMPKPQEIAVICSSLVSLVSYKDKRGRMVMELHLAHFSVLQYLRSQPIVKVCLAYLTNVDKKGPIREIEADFPLAEYSAEAWVHHAKLVETEDDVQESILKFFLGHERHYSAWARIYSRDSMFTRRDKAVAASPLYYASLADLKCIVHRLLEEGADINANGGGQGTALQADSSGGYRTIVQLLLEKGANIDAQDDLSGNALQAATAGGHDDVVQLLIKKGATVRTEGGMFGGALQAACFMATKKL
ncbi:Pfs, NACHT and ankyrin domain protein [Aspergillus insuetus]